MGQFLEPKGPIAYSLTEDFLHQLIARGDVSTENEARKGRDIPESTGKTRVKANETIFGIEDIAPPPPLPADLLEGLLNDIRVRRKAYKRSPSRKKATAAPPIDSHVSDRVFPAAFYMTLPTLQGDNIPGEGRIPLEAIELAKDFWGWPNEYSKEVSPRAGQNRIYWNWRPRWRIWSVEEPQNLRVQEVRMYMYENSSDFRFYVRPLVNAGGNIGDVVRIRRISGPDFEFECVLARRGTIEYNEWINYCTQPVRNSTRSFGYA